MGKIYEYKGRKFELSDGLTIDEAKQKILNYLATESESTEATEAAPTQPDAPTEPEYEGFIKEFGEGIIGGGIEAVAGVAELGASAIDYAQDTNYSRDVTRFKNELKKDLGVDPAGLVGEITQAVTQFAVPGLGAAGLASKLAKVRNFTKGANRLSQIGAAGVADFAVATDGTTTIGDFFGGGPTLTAKDVGASGKEEAKRRLTNKLKVGLEAAGATAAIEPMLRVFGIGKETVGAAPAVGETLDSAAQQGAGAVSKTSQAFSSTVKRVAKTVGVDEDKLDRVAAFFRARGDMPQEGFERSSTLRGETEAQIGRAAQVIKSLQKDLDDLFASDEMVDITINGSSIDRNGAMNMLHSFLSRDAGWIDSVKKDAARLNMGELDFTNDAVLAKFLPDFMQKDALKMRGQITSLVNGIKRSDFIQSGAGGDLEQAITDNVSDYMGRKFAAFENPNWFETVEFKDAYKNAINFYRENGQAAKDVWDDLGLGPLPDDFIAGGRVKSFYAKQIAKEFADRYRTPTALSANQLTQGQRFTARNRLRTGLFSKKQIQEPVLRAMLGEKNDPLESFITTISDLAEFRAVNSFYDFMGRRFLDQGNDFISEAAFGAMSEGQRKALLRTHKQLGGSGSERTFGALTGAYVRAPIWESFHTLNIPGISGGLGRGMYGTFLQAKGASQFSKTVLSPITQVRNVISASLFALAQGNIGRGGNLFDSVLTVANSISKNDPAGRLNFFRKLQELGVVGTQTQIRELDKLFEEGLGGSLKGHLDDMGVNVSRTKGTIRSKLNKSGFGRFLDSALIEPGAAISTRAKDLYQGGDDIWKIYNFQFEKNKVLRSLGEEGGEKYARDMGFGSLDEYAADIVKNTVPNYERVPEVIKQLRKLPVGNFIAFPAEIIRTSGNTLRYAIRELQSSDAGIRAIGLKRLMGFTATAGGLSTATQKIAMYATETDQDQIDSLGRTAPYWSKNSTLLPTQVKRKTGPDGKEKNYITGYVDFSFVNPYDYWQRPFNAVINAQNRGEIMNLDADKVAMDASLGVIKEMFSPFMEESIITEKFIDLTRGTTRTGRAIYDKPSGDFGGDPLLDKGAKMFLHVADAFLPGAVEQVVGKIAPKPELGGEIGFVPSRLATSILAEDGRDARGNIRKLEQEILAFVTGARQIDVKADDIVKYNAFDYGQELRDASSPFNRASRVQNKIDPQNVLDAYVVSNEKRYRLQGEMFRLIQDMRNLGLDKNEIRKALTKNKVGDVDMLLQGKYTPAPISDEIIDQGVLTQKEIGGRYPTKELFGLQRQYRRLKLMDALPEVEMPQVNDDVSSITVPEPRTLDTAQVQPQPQPVAAATAPPVAAQAGAASAPLAVPATNPLANANPITLPDPRDQMLAQRLRGVG